MSFWKRTQYPGDAIDQRIRETAKSLVDNKQAKAVAIIVIDNDGLAHGNIALRGVGLAPSKEQQQLQRQLAERLFEYQNSLS